jgi:hypothetical protein
MVACLFQLFLTLIFLSVVIKFLKAKKNYVQWMTHFLNIYKFVDIIVLPILCDTISIDVIFKSLNCPKMFHVNRDSSSLVRKMVVVV